MKEVEYQKQLTNKVVAALKEYGYKDITVAGGAPRDWFFDVSATDIDIYIGGSQGFFGYMLCVGDTEIRDAIKPIYPEVKPVQLGCTREGSIPEQYQHNLHLNQVMEFKVEGLVFQIMDVTGTDSVSGSLMQFPFNMCMAKYENGEVKVSGLFNEGAHRGALIKTRGDYNEDELYVKKVKSKFPHYHYYESVMAFELEQEWF